MRVTQSLLQRTFAFSVLLALSQASAAWAQAADDTQSAVWVPKEFKFVYQGFTTKYSCDGLRDKMRTVLLNLGARKDLHVNSLGCIGPSGVPDPFPGVVVKMNVLAPAGTAGAAAGEAALPSHWKPVTLQLDRSPLSEAGECELIEQVKQQVLPLFTTRNVDFKDVCVPHQLSPGGTHLSAEVLVPDQTKVGTTAAN
jgi:hypothetical protein